MVGSCDGFQDMDQGGVVISEFAAPGPKAGIFHLPFTSAPSELLPKLINREQPRYIGGMAAREASSRGANRDTAAKFRLAGCCRCGSELGRASCRERVCQYV